MSDDAPRHKFDEASYTRGANAAWRRILSEAVSQLGGEGDAVRWRIERSAVVEALRELCERHGDNDWPDTLHLADVIRKHLHSHLSVPALEDRAGFVRYESVNTGNDKIRLYGFRASGEQVALGYMRRRGDNTIQMIEEHQ